MDAQVHLPGRGDPVGDRRSSGWPRGVGLRVAERRSLGPDYARTLAHWQRNFRNRWDRVAALGFDETFRRMWEFYLAYCEAGFRVDYLDVHQFALQPR